jgi:hypothetical protein
VEARSKRICLPAAPPDHQPDSLEGQGSHAWRDLRALSLSKGTVLDLRRWLVPCEQASESEAARVTTAYLLDTATAGIPD